LDPCEALAQIVVHVLADATLLALTYSQDLLLKPLAFGNIDVNPS
jgi:hypothetical protein